MLRKISRWNVQRVLHFISSFPQHSPAWHVEVVHRRPTVHATARLGGILLWLSVLGLGAAQVHAQPTGWSQAQSIVVTEHSGTALSGYQLRMVIDTSAMAPGAADLRFATDAAGGNPLAHWVESGAGTPNTVVWVRLASLAASAQSLVYQFSGNPAAVDTSSLVDVFDYDSPVNNSATLQVASGTAGGGVGSQVGFRFTPKEDILLVSLGKREPNGTTRYVTLFDVSSQSKLAQMQINGPAATYSYQDLSHPLWLSQGVQYQLNIFQGAGDRHYYGVSTQINPKLYYQDTRVCNNCTPDTFPTRALLNVHYGYPDFQFRTRQQVSVPPTWVYGALAPAAPGITPTAGDGQASFAISPPRQDGGRPIQDYTVACAPLDGGATLENTGSTSPLIVTGLFNGTTYRCTATARNEIGVGAASPTVEVTPIAALAITNQSFGHLRVGDAFHLQLLASGGLPPYVWTAMDVGQPLPMGLQLSPDGVLSGMPTNAGAYSTLVTVSDSRGTPRSATQVLKGVVAAADVAEPAPVHDLGALGLVSLVSAIGVIGLRRTRKKA